MSKAQVTTKQVLDLADARSKSTIDVPKARDYLHGGTSNWNKRVNVSGVIANDPTFDKSRREFMSRTERYERGQKITDRLFELQEHHAWTPEELNLALSAVDEPLSINLHMVAFEPVFRMQASPTLLGKYANLIASRGILGCYLQTELGHGSNVSKLETTATFIPDTQEFEIHSPTLTSTKWWIGALGKTSTHGVVQAKLLLPGGQDVGPHLFFMQLRDMSTHKPLPGITLGDIGPKVLHGYQAPDNGFARFDHVRVPKENMLSKFAQVTDEGKYVKPLHAKLSYGGMLYIRSSSGGWAIARAATISIRYTTVRRQGEVGSDGLERQVISYPSTYYRLLPILAHAYVYIELGRALTRSFDEMAARLSTGDASLLAELHAITSGLKVTITSVGILDIETARRSMGGHGYSAFSGLGSIYADYVPSATYEGDNFVLDQQVIRAALKAFRSFTPSTDVKLLPPSSTYLRLLRGQPSLSSDWSVPETPILYLEWRAVKIVQELAHNANDTDASMNQRVSKAVTEAFIARQVGEMIKTLNSKSGLKGRSAVVVAKLYLLHLLTTVESALVDILSFGILAPSEQGRDPTLTLRKAVKALCEELLPEAVGLTDAFGFTDFELNSALGVSDGNAYQALWDAAQMEPLNQDEVTPAYRESIRPMLLRGQRIAGKTLSKL
ncbi:hypothetical protein CCMSSC00406_0003533 [Pleurotus cornucopiae]|uniref:Uncharacterized protein n=1 Tax=Pleurotus cornucopiae TaxID=5321 RepID=A0ACB7IHP0_PLECO|nr:hypothetical protein CCMSSC00406_0003533 [Pleurotus cornucopiae]